MNKEAIKERLSWLRLLLTIVASSDLATIAWLIGNKNIQSDNLIFIAVFVIFTLTGIFLYLNGEILHYIKKIED